MASRSVNNLQFCRDDMRRAYREKARRKRGGIKIRDIIDILDIVVPVIPHFFGGRVIGANCSSGLDSYSSNLGYAGREDDIPSIRCGLGDANGGGGGRFGRIGMASDDYGNGSGHGNVRAHCGMGMDMASHADDYGDREISEEEFERLLDFAEQCNVKKY